MGLVAVCSPLKPSLAVRWAYGLSACIRDYALIVLKALFFILSVKELAKLVPVYIIITGLRLAYSGRST